MKFLTFLSLTLVVACGPQRRTDDGASGSSTDTGGTSGGTNPGSGYGADAGSSGNGTGTGGAPDGGLAGGLAILSATTNATKITPSRSVTFTTLLSDTNGLPSIVGGTLSDANGGTYGAFTSTATPGSYALTLTWSDVNALASIDAPAGGVTRTFQEKFFDNAGATATKDLSLTLACDQAGDGACAGECVDLQSDLANCGRCRNDCTTTLSLPSYAFTTDPGTTCAAGHCAATVHGKRTQSCQDTCSHWHLSCGVVTYDAYSDGACRHGAVGESLDCSGYLSSCISSCSVDPSDACNNDSVICFCTQ